MTDTPPVPPQSRSRWWTILLVASLMANLLFAGWFIGNRYMMRHGGDRMAGVSMVQVVPRTFFSNLPQERRRELLRGIREEMRGLRHMRDGSSQLVLQLSDALRRDPFDAQEANTVVDSFSTGPESLAVRGSKVLKDLISKLSPEERKLLATAMRERAEREKSRKK